MCISCIGDAFVMLPFFLKYKEDKVINSRGYDREKNIMFN
jgi:hypothetical protein